MCAFSFSILELCCGTKSFSKACKSLNILCVTLDINRDFEADIVCDILEWDYRSSAYTPGQFHVIWASPPCTEYSRALTTRDRRLDYADSIVIRVVEIINYFRPKYAFIENPTTGLLPKRELLPCFVENRLSYCMYGMPYQKDTSIWSNYKIPDLLLCTHTTPCLSRSVFGRHKLRAQAFDMRSSDKSILYPMPPMLLYHILHCILSSDA
jgi:hypothetical protein